MNLDYLQQLRDDFLRQIREYENNAAAARGALQVINHLIQKTTDELGKNDSSVVDPEKQEKNV